MKDDKIMQSSPPPTLRWLNAKQMLFPRILTALKKRYGDISHVEVVDIESEGFPDPEEVITQNRTNGWSVYYNNPMKLHPVVKIIVDGEKKRVKVPAIINALFNYSEEERSWSCTSFSMITVKN